jgi:uncharacterized protein YkwD
MGMGRYVPLLALAAALVAPPAPAAAQQDPACLLGSRLAAEIGQAATRSSVLCLVNAERAKRGLRAVAGSWRLRRAAQGHSDDMVARDYFDHVTPGGSGLAERVGATGYLRRRPDWALGEAIGWAEGALATPSALMSAWMASPPHRRVILDGRYRDLGVGVAMAGPQPDAGAAVTVTLDFGVAR